MRDDNLVTMIFVAFIGMLAGGFIQYQHDVNPKYACVDGVLHERFDSSKDVYISRNVACLKAK
jgi:hypothetical protein